MTDLNYYRGVFSLNPTEYYFRLRRLGYTPRNAAMSTMMWFCTSYDEFRQRANNIARLVKELKNGG